MHLISKHLNSSTAYHIDQPCLYKQRYRGAHSLICPTTRRPSNYLRNLDTITTTLSNDLFSLLILDNRGDNH